MDEEELSRDGWGQELEESESAVESNTQAVVVDSDGTSSGATAWLCNLISTSYMCPTRRLSHGFPWFPFPVECDLFKLRH